MNEPMVSKLFDANLFTCWVRTGRITMSRLVVLIAIVTLHACASTEIRHDFSDTMPIDDAASFIEQVLMEQPARYRPESVDVTSEYVAYGKGVVSHSSGIGVPIGNSGITVNSGNSKSKFLSERIYFNSPFSVSIVPSGKWFVIQVINGEGYRIARVYTTSQDKAVRFDDALHSLQKNYSIQHSRP